MPGALASVLAGFHDPMWSSNVSPGTASADARFFITERRTVPLIEAVMSAMSKKGCLVDAPGGEMVVIESAAVGEVLGSTWAAMCVMATADGSAITYRGLRGSDLNKMCSAARAELGSREVAGDPLIARRAVLDAGVAAQPYPPPFRSGSDEQKLHRWAMERLARDIEKIIAPAASGGLGFERERIRLDGGLYSGAGSGGTPSLVQPNLHELLGRRPNSDPGTVKRSLHNSMARAAVPAPHKQVAAALGPWTALLLRCMRHPRRSLALPMVLPREMR